MKQERTSVALPSIPDGETEATIEAQRIELVVMFNNRSTDLTKIKMPMGNTFAHRRKEVLVNNIRVWKLLNEYPFLKDCNGVEVSSLLLTNC